MILLNNKSGISPSSPYYKLFLFGLVALIIYFIWMDIALYVHLQHWSPPPIINKSMNQTAVKDTEEITTFNPLTVKLIMVDHWTHLIHDILARFLFDSLGLAKTFYWMSANQVSFFGLFSALIGSVMIVSDNLMYRQIGAFMFELRNLADSLDGSFSRTRRREQAELIRLNDINAKVEEVKFVSTYGTVGYNVDIICDIFGGAFFCIALLYRFLRRPPQKQIQSPKSPAKHDYKYSKLTNDSDTDFTAIKMSKAIEDTTQFKSSKVSESVKEAFSSPESSFTTTSRRHYSHREIKIIIISFGLRILATGYLWDHFVHKYHDLLMVFSENPTHRKLQGEAFRSTSMWLVMWFWRVANGCAILEHMALATFFDKLWDYVVLTTYIGWGYLVLLAIITQIHYTELYNSLNRLSSFM